MVEQTSDPNSTDDGLTSLNWLVKPAPFFPLNPPTPPSTPPPALPLQNLQLPVRPKEIDYKVEAIKPPYSYAQMITMAMRAFGGGKVVLTDIYQWIRDNFCYFRGSDNSWQNSIRHNLSLNKQFIKVPRETADKGKGSYWMLDPKTYRKDPYCIRRRNFFETHSRRPRPVVDKPQVNPAIKSFLEKTQRAQQTFRHPFGGTGERLEDIGAQECVYTDANPGFDDFNQKLFKKDVESYSGYVPQNDLVSQTTETLGNPTQPNSGIPEISLSNSERVRVEYNWEGYEYHPSNVFGAQLPLQLSPGGLVLNPGIAVVGGVQEMVTSANMSPPTSDDADTQPCLNLRIPTPEWWSSQVTTASLLSPTGGNLGGYGGQNPLAKVFENLNGSCSNTGAGFVSPLTNENQAHPWQEKMPEPVVTCSGQQGALFDLDCANSSAASGGVRAENGLQMPVTAPGSCEQNELQMPVTTPGSCEFVDVVGDVV